MTLNLFVSGEVHYRRTPDLGLLRCVDAVEASKIIEHIHVGVRGTHYAWAYFCKKDPSIWVLLNDYGE